MASPVRRCSGQVAQKSNLVGRQTVSDISRQIHRSNVPYGAHARSEGLSKGRRWRLGKAERTRKLNQRNNVKPTTGFGHSSTTLDNSARSCSTQDTNAHLKEPLVDNACPLPPNASPDLHFRAWVPQQELAGRPSSSSSPSMTAAGRRVPKRGLHTLDTTRAALSMSDPPTMGSASKFSLPDSSPSPQLFASMSRSLFRAQSEGALASSPAAAIKRVETPGLPPERVDRVSAEDLRRSAGGGSHESLGGG